MCSLVLVQINMVDFHFDLVIKTSENIWLTDTIPDAYPEVNTPSEPDPSQVDLAGLAVDTGEALLDDIRTEYHPHSGRPTHVNHFIDYGSTPSEEPKVQLPDDQKPWYPFRSRVDFEFAEIALKSHLNKRAVNTLIAIVKACSSGQASFTLDSHEEMRELLHGASSKLTSVRYFTNSLLFLFMASSV